MSMIQPHFFEDFGEKMNFKKWTKLLQHCHVLVLLQCVQFFGRFRRNFAQFLGDFGEKLIPFTITCFCLLQGEQFLEDFAKFLGDFGEKLIPFAVTSFCLLQCEQFLGDFGENLHYF